jgi:hypothetical protein
MRNGFIKQTLFLTPIVVLAAMLLAGAAQAKENKDAAYYQEQFARWTTGIATLQKTDTTGVGVEEIEKLRTAMSQAQALAAAEKFGEILPIEARLDVKMRFTQTWLERVAKEAAATAAEEKAAQADALAKKAKGEAETAKARFAELEAKGL